MSGLPAVCPSPSTGMWAGIFVPPTPSSSPSDDHTAALPLTPHNVLYLRCLPLPFNKGCEPASARFHVPRHICQPPELPASAMWDQDAHPCRLCHLTNPALVLLTSPFAVSATCQM
ncbi:unnamed protein product [Cyclocybe aegerita]|uniref:Uncharacterized protein n=1 Tax=Cyclocybe aegerita TaxID=1973307 RepID=A0A8S0X802_CYCAE|nr:unnamed protein product [Cyclocybe aegerita]